MKNQHHRFASVLWILCLALNGCGHQPQSNSSNDPRNAKTSLSPAANTFAKAAGQLAIHIRGNQFINERGNKVTLHGAGIMGMEYTAITELNAADPYPTIVESTWTALHQWHINIIRIPLNEISYLGLKCVSSFTGPAFKKTGKTQDPDPGHNYKTRLNEVIDRATAERLYVVLALHTAAPDDRANAVDGVTAQCAYELNPLPDEDHAVEFWKDVANTYKNYPNIIFELYSDPFIDQWPYFHGDKIAAWKALRDGALINMYLPLWPTPEKHLWRSAGMQQLVNTIRSTGAANIILQGGLSHSADLGLWLTYKAEDPLKQSAAAWHAFPPANAAWGGKCYSHPGPWCDDRSYSYARKIIDANYPVVVTAFGDKNAPGTVGAPFVSSLLPHLDTLGISYLAWTFSSTKSLANELLKDNLGTPSNGYGEYVKAHYLCVALKAPNCSSSEISTSTSSNGSRALPQQSITRGLTLWTAPN